jgi:hypothetical protein
MGADFDGWIEKVRRSEYLTEDELKTLCEYVSPGSMGGVALRCRRPSLAARSLAATACR